MTEPAWSIVLMERMIADGFLFTVRYRVQARNGDRVAEFNDTVGFAPVPGRPVKPFEQLTEAEILGWIKSLRDVAGIEAMLTKAVESA